MFSLYDKEYNSYIIYNIDIGYIFLTLFINFDEYWIFWYKFWNKLTLDETN